MHLVGPFGAKAGNMPHVTQIARKPAPKLAFSKYTLPHLCAKAVTPPHSTTAVGISKSGTTSPQCQGAVGYLGKMHSTWSVL